MELDIISNTFYVKCFSIEIHYAKSNDLCQNYNKIHVWTKGINKSDVKPSASVSPVSFMVDRLSNCRARVTDKPVSVSLSTAASSVVYPVAAASSVVYPVVVYPSPSPPVVYPSPSSPAAVTILPPSSTLPARCGSRWPSSSSEDGSTDSSSSLHSEESAAIRSRRRPCKIASAVSVAVPAVPLIIAATLFLCACSIRLTSACWKSIRQRKCYYSLKKQNTIHLKL